MDADRKRQILNAEARAELISTLVAKGFYVYSPDEIERWHRARGGAPDHRSATLASNSGAPGPTDAEKSGCADYDPNGPAPRQAM